MLVDGPLSDEDRERMNILLRFTKIPGLQRQIHPPREHEDDILAVAYGKSLSTKAGEVSVAKRKWGINAAFLLEPVKPNTFPLEVDVTKTLFRVVAASQYSDVRWTAVSALDNLSECSEL
jgi:hypothetical protein